MKPASRIFGIGFLMGSLSTQKNLSNIVEAVWVNEADKESPDWPGCLRVFEKVVRLGITWGKPLLSDTAIRGIAVIMDGYQQKPAAALEALDQLAVGSGRDSALTRNARALVLFHLQRFDEALELWRSTLPMWSVHDLTEASAIRLAAVTAGKLGRWNECADLFDEARVLAIERSMNLIQKAVFRFKGRTLRDELENVERRFLQAISYPAQKPGGNRQSIR